VPGLDALGRVFLVIGGIVIVLGLLMLGLGRLLGAGRVLPGDIVIQRPGFTLVFAIVTSIVLSVILTILLRLISAWRR
jgi:hypothetical protein